MSDTPDIHFGIKRITSSNWQTPEVPEIFTNMTQEIWLREHLAPKLNPEVPENIAALYEVARGSMIYGWFFYPLITLGAEQCMRVLETAVRICCENNGIQIRTEGKDGKTYDTTFAKNIRALIKKGIIPAKDEKLWMAAKDIRNYASHPESQAILPPGMTLTNLKITADRLNYLSKHVQRKM